MNLLKDRKNVFLSAAIAAGMEMYNGSGYFSAFVALWIFFFFLLQLFTSFGKRLPIRILFMFFMGFQLLFTAYLSYFVYPDYQFYKMEVPPDVYFSFVNPAVLCFGLGLYWNEKKHQQLEAIDFQGIQRMALNNPGIAYFFIGFGIVAAFAGQVFSGAGLEFIFYVLGLLKFVGLFLVIIGSIKLKRWLIIVIYATIIISSFRDAMFHDLIIWSVFLFSVLALKYQPNFQKKLALFVGGILVVLFIQVIKETYRTNLERTDASLSVVINSAEQVQQESGGLFSIATIAPQISRFNQGWIVASIMDNVPNNVPYAEGETIKLYFEAAFLPRAWAPNKLKAGDKDIFNKYCGRKISDGTSMALSSVGDAYINFGIEGGWIFMFIWGLCISVLMNFMSKKSNDYPFLPLFALVIFAYAIRIECEMQTIMGHIVKSAVILWAIFLLYQRMLRRYFVSVTKRTPRTPGLEHDIHPV